MNSQNCSCPSQFCLIWHYTLFYLSSSPLFVENTQTKVLIITLIPSSETALYSQLPHPACCPCTAGPGHLKHTSFLSVLMPSFPDYFQFVLEKSLLIPFFQRPARVPLALSLFLISFSLLPLGRSPAALPTLQYSDLIL